MSKEDIEGARSFVLFWVLILGGWLFWQRWVVYFDVSWWTFLTVHWQYQTWFLALYIQYLVLRRKYNELG